MTLTLVTFLPLAGALLLMLMPREEEGLHRGVALATALITFAASLFMLSGFDPAGWNLVVDKEWIPSLGIHYKLGVDGISLWLVLLTTFLMPIVLLSSWSAVHRKVREFCVTMLVLETGLLGTFLALDLFFFYVFWEIMLIPMYLIIGIWGGDRRLYASIKFVLYTMVGSLLMVVAILYLYVQNHDATKIWTFDYQAISSLVLAPKQQLFCFLAFALAFAIKVPLFPLHTWLPDAHVEAPTAGSVLLAAVLLKMGTYGFIRYAMPLFPIGVELCAPLISTLAVVGIIYGSLVAFAQKDIKKMIAYSSVAHLGFVVLGLMMWNQKSVDGAVYQMLAHGISTGGLFLCVGVLYERRHKRSIDEFGGVASVMPRFTAVFLIITLASIGLPGLSGFVGEFLVLIGTFVAYTTWGNLPYFAPHPKVLAVLASTGVILSAVYMLYMFQKVMFGPLTNVRNRDLKDLSAREVVVFAPILLMAFWLGVYPNTFLSDIDPAVQRTIAQFQNKYKTAIEDGEAPKLMQAPDVKPEPMPLIKMRAPLPEGGAEMSFDASQLSLIAPLLAVLGAGVLLLLLEAFGAGGKRAYLVMLTLVGVGLALALEVVLWDDAATAKPVFNGLLICDRLSVFLSVAFLAAAGLSALLAGPFMREHRFEFGEFYALLMFATAGMMILAAAADLVTVFIGIETMSIAVYVLTGSWRRSAKSSEGAMKYFITGAFATAILLYGIALIYGMTGTTSLKAISQNAHAASSPVFIIGMLLLIVALGFKMAAVPFHMWAPDAYEGAPTPVTAFMAAGVKTAAFGAALRVFLTAFNRNELAYGASGWASALSVLAILTMTLGNLAALKQDNIKRLLAYSSIAHAGYLLIGLVAMAVVGDEARGPLLFYLLAYTFTTIGAFGVVAWIGNRGDERLQLDDWAGLASRHPAAALAMTVFMLSLGGIPPTAGFFAKFYLFRAALEKTGLLPLVVIAVLNSVVSVYYYLRVVTAMYFREVGREPQPIRDGAMTAALWIAVAATLAIGLLPGWFVDTAAAAVLGG